MDTLPRIAVCDDSPEIHQQIYELLLEYGQQHPQEQMLFCAYSNKEALLSNEETLDLLFLDIELGEIQVLR